MMYQVISEGLRRGILPQTQRECTKAWKIPGANFVIPAGMNVIIPSVRTFSVIKTRVLKLVCLVWAGLGPQVLDWSTQVWPGQVPCRQEGEYWQYCVPAFRLRTKAMPGPELGEDGVQDHAHRAAEKLHVRKIELRNVWSWIFFRMKPNGSYTEDRPWEKDVFIGFKKVNMTFVRRS